MPFGFFKDIEKQAKKTAEKTVKAAEKTSDFAKENLSDVKLDLGVVKVEWDKDGFGKGFHSSVSATVAGGSGGLEAGAIASYRAHIGIDQKGGYAAAGVSISGTHSDSSKFDSKDLREARSDVNTRKGALTDAKEAYSNSQAKVQTAQANVKDKEKKVEELKKDVAACELRRKEAGKKFAAACENVLKVSLEMSDTVNEDLETDIRLAEAEGDAQQLAAALKAQSEFLARPFAALLAEYQKDEEHAEKELHRLNEALTTEQQRLAKCHSQLDKAKAEGNNIDSLRQALLQVQTGHRTVDAFASGPEDGLYFIKAKDGTNERKFLSCSDDGERVDLWHEVDCSGRQMWRVTTTERFSTVEVSGGTGDRKYLSCTDDGEKVDLWTHDDSSGRQRWEFKQNSNGTWRIVSVTGRGEFLSCKHDGTKCDLWHEDDESGRQRWILEPAHHADHEFFLVDKFQAQFPKCPDVKAASIDDLVDEVERKRERFKAKSLKTPDYYVVHFDFQHGRQFFDFMMSPVAAMDQKLDKGKVPFFMPLLDPRFADQKQIIECVLQKQDTRKPKTIETCPIYIQFLQSQLPKPNQKGTDPKLMLDLPLWSVLGDKERVAIEVALYEQWDSENTTNRLARDYFITTDLSLVENLLYYSEFWRTHADKNRKRGNMRRCRVYYGSDGCEVSEIKLLPICRSPLVELPVSLPGLPERIPAWVQPGKHKLIDVLEAVLEAFKRKPGYYYATLPSGSPVGRDDLLEIVDEALSWPFKLEELPEIGKVPDYCFCWPRVSCEPG